MGYRTFYRYMAPLRPKQRAEKADIAVAPLTERFSAKEAVWLLVRDPTGLDGSERATLTTLCQESATVETISQLVQAFVQMVRTLRGEGLDTWLEQARVSQIPQLVSFVGGIERDKAAVIDGLTRHESTRPTEGYVNKVKVIKRQMYGRAGFPLLRKRVLHAV